MSSDARREQLEEAVREAEHAMELAENDLDDAKDALRQFEDGEVLVADARKKLARAWADNMPIEEVRRLEQLITAHEAPPPEGAP